MYPNLVALLLIALATAFAWAISAQIRLRAERRARTAQAKTLHMHAKTLQVQAKTLQVMDEERRILELIAHGSSLKDVLNELTGAMERLTQGCLCSVLLLDEDKRRLHEGSGGSLPREYMQIVDGLEIGPEVGSCGTAAYRNETTIVTDIATDYRWAAAKDLPLGFGLYACWSVPIRDSAGAVLGTFAIYHRQPAVPAPGDLRTVEAAARLAGNAIERLTAEKKLRDSAERLALVEQTAHIGVWEMEGDSGVLTLSAGAAALNGMEPVAQRITFEAVDALTHPDDRVGVRTTREVANSPGVFVDEFRIPQPDGSIRWCRSVGRRKPSTDSRDQRVVGALMDITEEKLLLDQLRANADRMRLAEEAAGFGIWEWDPESGDFALTEGISRVIGLEPGTKLISAEQLYATVHADDRAPAAAARERALREGGAYEHEFRRVFPDGSIRWYRNRAHVEITAGRPARVVGATIDITQEKEMLNRLCRGAERLQLAQEAAGFAVWETDLKVNRTSFGESFAALHRLPTDTTGIPANGVSDLIHPDDRDAAIGAMYRAAADGTAFQVEYRLNLPDQELRWLRNRGRVERLLGESPRLVGACIDITQERVMVERLKESAQRMRLAEQAAGFGVWHIDLLAQTITVSEGLAALHQFPPEKPLTMTRAEFAKSVAPEHREAMSTKVMEMIRTGQPLAAEFHVPLPDGTKRWWRIQGKVEYSQGRPIAVFGATIDVTEQKEMMLALDQARQAAEAGARAKSDFLASMSHEIRTPMNGIIGMTGLLLDSNLTADQQEYAETVRNSSESLLAIINDILDFSKIEAGKLKIGSYPFNLRTVVEDVVEMLAPKAQEKHLEMVVDYPTQFPAHFIGDGDRIRQVLVNLVGNALKFTTQGQVLVRVEFDTETNTESSDRCRAIVSVTDTGIGIPAEKFGLLFAKFSQADSSITRRYGGTGLGLAICKQLVELMDGSIRVNSVEGEGSTFRFELPLKLEARHYADFGTAEPASVDVLKGLRVLIVDDLEANRRVVHEQILGFGMRNGSYANGEEALTAIARAQVEGDPFHIVVADFQMPGIDGATLAAAIKSDPATRDIVFIMLSSIGDWREVKGLEGEHVDACLVKPVRRTRLVKTLVETWSRKNAIIDPSDGAALAALHRNVTEQFLPSDVRVLIVEDNPVNQRVAMRMLQRLGTRADVAGNGLEALELLKVLPYDFVFMDCQMPEMDGYEATTRLRRMGGPNQHARVIALTADAISGCRERCLEAGMDDFISKPVKLDDFIHILKVRLVASQGVS